MTKMWIVFTYICDFCLTTFQQQATDTVCYELCFWLRFKSTVVCVPLLYSAMIHSTATKAHNTFYKKNTQKTNISFWFICFYFLCYSLLLIMFFVSHLSPAITSALKFLNSSDWAILWLFPKIINALSAFGVLFHLPFVTFQIVLNTLPLKLAAYCWCE